MFYFVRKGQFCRFLESESEVDHVLSMKETAERRRWGGEHQRESGESKEERESITKDEILSTSFNLCTENDFK